MTHRITPRRISQFAPAATFLISASLLLLRIPNPVNFALSHEFGSQLSAANEIVRGFQPIIDYSTFYGPLTYYVGALAQWISGVRPIGEITLAVVGYGLGYACFFWLTRSATRGYLLAIPGTICLLIAVPSLYKYYCVLAPAFALTAIWLYMDRPTRRRLWLVGLAVAASGLYRPDYGVSAMLAGSAAIMLESEHTVRERAIAVLYLAITVLVWASPWLIYVTARGGLDRYLYESSAGALSHAVDQSKPMPGFNFRHILSRSNAFPLLYRLLLVIPAAAAAVLALQWRSHTWQDRGKLVAMILIGGATLLTQAIYRADTNHLLQAIPTDLLILIWLIERAYSALRKEKALIRRAAGGIGLIVTLGTLSALMILTGRSWVTAVRGGHISHLSTYALPRDAFLDKVAEIAKGKNDRIRAFLYVRDCSQPDDGVLGWPYMAEIYYFTNRPAGNRLLAFSPGFYTTPDQQQETVKELESAKPTFWVYKPFKFIKNVQYIEDYEPIVAAYLKENYTPVQVFDNTTILIYNERKEQFHCQAK